MECCFVRSGLLSYRVPAGSWLPAWRGIMQPKVSKKYQPGTEHRARLEHDTVVITLFEHDLLPVGRFGAGSVELHADRLNHLRPRLGLRADECGEFFRRVGFRRLDGSG